MRGGLEREVKVDVDLARLKYYGLSMNDVVEAIRSENVNIPGGSIAVGDVDYLVRVDGEFADPAVIEELVLDVFDGLCDLCARSGGGGIRIRRADELRTPERQPGRDDRRGETLGREHHRGLG